MLTWVTDDIEIHVDPSLQLEIVSLDQHYLNVHWEGRIYAVPYARGEDGIWLSWRGKVEYLRIPIRSGKSSFKSEKGKIVAPMAGTIRSILVKSNEIFETGTVFLTLESMKMEYAITAPEPGQIEKICVAEGDVITEGALLVEWKEKTND